MGSRDGGGILMVSLKQRIQNRINQIQRKLDADMKTDYLSYEKYTRLEAIKDELQRLLKTGDEP